MKSSRDGRTPPGPDIAGLRAFALEDDRLPPPAFVGRQDIIADIEHAVAEAAAGGTAVRGRTRLVFGAPGAGKTALLNELARRWRARAADGDASAPVPVDCEPGDLTSPVAFTEVVLSALVPDSSVDVAKVTTTQGGSGIPGVAGLSVSRTTSVPSLVDSVRPDAPRGRRSARRRVPSASRVPSCCSWTRRRPCLATRMETAGRAC